MMHVYGCHSAALLYRVIQRGSMSDVQPEDEGRECVERSFRIEQIAFIYIYDKDDDDEDDDDDDEEDDDDVDDEDDDDEHCDGRISSHSSLHGPFHSCSSPHGLRMRRSWTSLWLDVLTFQFATHHTQM